MSDKPDVQAGYWNTSVTQLMTILRDTFLALVPHLDRARIQTDFVRGSDAWDPIAEALFSQFVLEPIKYGISASDAERDSICIPNYGFRYESYENGSFIEVLPLERHSSDSRYVFVSLASRRDMFDTVWCVVTNHGGRTVPDSLEEFFFPDVEFQFVRKDPGAEERSYTSLAVGD